MNHVVQSIFQWINESILLFNAYVNRVESLYDVFDFKSHFLSLLPVLF